MLERIRAEYKRISELEVGIGIGIGFGYKKNVIYKNHAILFKVLNKSIA